MDLGGDAVILITGPLFAGKTDFSHTLWPDVATFDDHVCLNAQTLAENCPNLPALADRLAAQYAVITLTEVGGGVVPTDPAQRAAREAAGRLGCLLAARADTVVRVFCGLPLVLKGDLPQ